MFCLVPSKQPDSPVPPVPTDSMCPGLQYVSPHPTAVFIIPAFACIPLRDSLLCLERQKKTVMSRTPHPPTSNPDGSHSSRTEQRDATPAKCRDFQSHKTEAELRKHDYLFFFSPFRNNNRIIQRRQAEKNTGLENLQYRAKVILIWQRQTVCRGYFKNNKPSRHHRKYPYRSSSGSSTGTLPKKKEIATDKKNNKASKQGQKFIFYLKSIFFIR